ILQKGELQINEKERSHQLTTLHLDIASTIADKCVDPATNLPYPLSVIQQAMHDAHINIHPTRSTKAQALEIIKLLKDHGTLNIARASMRIRVVVDKAIGKRVKEKFGEVAVVESEEWSEVWEWVALIDPGKFRAISEIVMTESKGRGVVEVLSVKETREGDEILS
ncbi:hypothetical protein HK096_001384, partial [Nowakowskiella sp. JEL0078]